MSRPRPRFFDVEHRFIRALGPESAFILAIAKLRAKRDLPLDSCQAAEWLGLHRTTVWRHVVELQARGLLDADRRPTQAAAEYPGVRGYVRVGGPQLRLGLREGVLLALLGSWGSLRMVRVVGGYVEARYRALAKFCACSARTVGELLRRLAGSARLRRSAQAQPGARIEIRRPKGGPAFVRLVAERLQRRRQSNEEAPQSPASGGGAPFAWHELLDMTRAATAPPQPTA